MPLIQPYSEGFTSISNKIRNLTVFRSIQLLPSGDRKKVAVVVLIQIGLGVFDLAAVALVGILGALTINGIQSKTPEGRIQSFLEIVRVEDFSFQSQVAILGSFAAFALISRTLLTVYFSRLTMFFLARRGASISSKLVEQILSQPLLFIRERNSQETLYAITYGVASITLGVIATFVTLISDGLLLVFLATGLIIVDPLTALLTFSLLGGSAIILHLLLHSRARRLGAKNSILTIEGNSLILEVLESYREAIVGNRRPFYSRKIGESRFNLANLSAEIAFLPNISKYAIEITMVVSALTIAAFQFIFYDSTQAIATLAVFLTASARIGPAVLRIQQSLIQIKNSVGIAEPTLDLIERLKNSKPLLEIVSPLNTVHNGFRADITVRNLVLKYPDRDSNALDCVSLKVEPGQHVAFVGPSGAGKTSFADAILGVVEPSSGDIFISGENPKDAFARWPGAVAYVPQEIYISDSTIRENVALGYARDEIVDELVWEALQKAHLEDLIKVLPRGIAEPVGERGSRLSGGQRQRLGIARALYTNPKVIVFDEATSALDGETEAKLAKTLNGLRGKTTVIMIAHRLSTVRSADNVVYMEKGQVIAQGTFESVRVKVPKFEDQARLMGL